MLKLEFGIKTAEREKFAYFSIPYRKEGGLVPWDTHETLMKYESIPGENRTLK
jgi:hypothetical protein